MHNIIHLHPALYDVMVLVLYMITTIMPKAITYTAIMTTGQDAVGLTQTLQVSHLATEPIQECMCV